MNLPADNEFTRQLFLGMLQDSFAFQSHNIDFRRYRYSVSGRSRLFLHAQWHSLLSRWHLTRPNFSVCPPSDFLSFLVDHLDELKVVYDSLSDEYSRRFFIEILKFRSLGPYHVKLPSNNKGYWQAAASLDQYCVKRNTLMTRVAQLGGRPGALNLYQVEGERGPLKCHTYPYQFFCSLLLHQYRYARDDHQVDVEQGDTVIDAGACWGDTTLGFADKSGADGRVYSFEFEPENLRILRKNLEENKHLKPQIQIVNNALWNCSGQAINYNPHGEGTGLNLQQNGNETVTTLTIDDFCKQEKLEKVDFIKMDIEGAEMKALQGARATILQFQPKLALVIYHKTDDFTTIPNFLRELNVGYEFYMDQVTIDHEETVLFAKPAKNERSQQI